MLRLRDCCSEFKSLARDFLQIGIKSAYALFSRVAIVNSYWPKNVFFFYSSVVEPAQLSPRKKASLWRQKNFEKFSTL